MVQTSKQFDAYKRKVKFNFKTKGFYFLYLLVR